MKKEIINFRKNISQICSCLIVMQNAVNNDTDDISSKNLYENLQVILVKLSDSLYETKKIKNDVIENENYEQLKLELSEINDSLLILRIALEHDINNEIQSGETDSFLNIMIKKAKSAVYHANNVEFTKYPNEY